jgi:hypothetical protein
MIRNMIQPVKNFSDKGAGQVLLQILSTKMQTVRKRENGASFCHLWMGNLVIYILLRQALICQSAPGSSRQQRAAATSVARSVSYPRSVSSVVWLQTAYSRRQLTMNEGE